MLAWNSILENYVVSGNCSYGELSFAGKCLDTVFVSFNPSMHSTVHVKSKYLKIIFDIFNFI